MFLTDLPHSNGLGLVGTVSVKVITLKGDPTGSDSLFVVPYFRKRRVRTRKGKIVNLYNERLFEY